MNHEPPAIFSRPPRSSIPGQIRRSRARAKIRAEIDTPGSTAASGASSLAKNRRGLHAIMPPIPLERARSEWDSWFAAKNWRPFDYQTRSWATYGEGKSGLIVLPTGSGKTYAALGGPLIELRSQGVGLNGDGLRILYVSPLKALTRDIEKAIMAPLRDLHWDITVETRTGDTSMADRRRQTAKLPHVLLTTPESLALLLTQAGWRERLGGLQAIVIDEWHELISSKRGSLLELSLAHLRSAAPQARTWAVSATIADTQLAARIATGVDDFTLVETKLDRPVRIETIMPTEVDDLPWFGHYGLRRIPEVVAQIDLSKTTLIFTNTRGQAERWFAGLLAFMPEWDGKVGLHHGSLDREERERIENAVKQGTLPLVVATSSLDLGVDFPTVEKVIQLGSVKSVARAIQRAGRAFHRPGEATTLTVCPTHFMEYVEVAALREAIATGELEPRVARENPLDVLVQFVLNAALPEGFAPAELLRVIRSAYSFRAVTDEEFAWVLSFVTTGGRTLQAYPQFQKLVEGSDGSYRFATPQLARDHRMNIGTIVSESGVQVKFMRGSKLGQIDEGFVTKLKRGEVFSFGGRTLELLHIQDQTAYVKLAARKVTAATVWGGQSLPISPSLSHLMRNLIGRVARSLDSNPNLNADLSAEKMADLPVEIQALGSTFVKQRARSAIPLATETLIERIESREGHHLFIYTWEGRAVNEGLGHLLAYRLSRISRNTIAVAANDHGFECLGTQPFPDDEGLRSALRADEALAHDIEHSLNYAEMAKRAFREIARVSGLLHAGRPSERKSTRQLQMSASLLFDVFRQYDPTHPLLLEAFREVQHTQLEFSRLRRVLAQIEASSLRIVRPDRLTPFAFPLFVDRTRSRLSTESLADRIAHMQKKVFA